MKNKLGKFIVFILGFVFAIVSGFYIFVACYYKQGFSYNTVINGIYCTGLSIEEVNNRLLDLYEPSDINISSDFHESEIISISDIDYAYDYTSSLIDFLNNQNPWAWPLNLFSDSLNYHIEPSFSFDKEKLSVLVDNLQIFKEYSIDRESVNEILYDTARGYYLYSVNNTYLDKEKFLTIISDSLLEGNNSIFIFDSDLYEKEISPDDVETLKTWTLLSDYLKTRIIYDMGTETIPIDASVLSLFIVRLPNGEFKTNSDGSLAISKDAVGIYIDSICKSYDTYKMPRKYKTYNGEIKNINFSVYGTKIDRNAEVDYLYESVSKSVEENHIPAYINQGFVRGLDDIGNTFIEVDLTNQVLYYVKDNELLLNCDIVSGKPSTGDATPEVIAYLIRKQRNVYLRGADYVSFVKYWMPFYSADGFHDASWQKKFGGDRYIKYGSHGCINMRGDDAKFLFDSAEVGTPVIVYK